MHEIVVLGTSRLRVCSSFYRVGNITRSRVLEFVDIASSKVFLSPFWYLGFM